MWSSSFRTGQAERSRFCQWGHPMGLLWKFLCGRLSLSEKSAALIQASVSKLPFTFLSSSSNSRKSIGPLFIVSRATLMLRIRSNNKFENKRDWFLLSIHWMSCGFDPLHVFVRALTCYKSSQQHFRIIVIGKCSCPRCLLFLAAWVRTWCISCWIL